MCRLICITDDCDIEIELNDAEVKRNASSGAVCASIVSSSIPSRPSNHSAHDSVKTGTCSPPRWCLHLVHALCALLIVSLAGATLAFAHQYNSSLALRWLLISLTGCLISLLILEPIKVSLHISLTGGLLSLLMPISVTDRLLLTLCILCNVHCVGLLYTL